MLYKIITKVD